MNNEIRIDVSKMDKMTTTLSYSSIIFRIVLPSCVMFSNFNMKVYKSFAIFMREIFLSLHYE